MRWLGLFTWDNDLQSLVLPYPPLMWREERATVGGRARSTGGILAGYAVRVDHRLHLPLRITAVEWPQLQAMLAWGEIGGTLVWIPDAAEPWQSFTVTLDEPGAGGSAMPEPDPSYPKVRQLSLVLRRVDGAAFNLDYFSEPLPEEPS